jgi:hypothetical protein
MASLSFVLYDFDPAKKDNGFEVEREENPTGGETSMEGTACTNSKANARVKTNNESAIESRRAESLLLILSFP